MHIVMGKVDQEIVIEKRIGLIHNLKYIYRHEGFIQRGTGISPPKVNPPPSPLKDLRGKKCMMNKLIQ